MPKNIRALTQQFHAARPKMKLHNSAFLDQVEDDREKAKTAGDKRAIVAKVTAHVRSITDANQGAAFTAELGEVTDGWLAYLDVLDAEISANTEGNRAAGTVGESGWINAETGAPVVMLAPAERLRDTARSAGQAGSDSAGATVGGIVQALLTGKKTPAVQAALSEGDASAGGYSIPLTVLPNFIDRLRAATTFVKAGARTLMLDGAKTRIVKVLSDPVAGWRAENGPVGEGQPTFGALDFAPKSLAVLVKASVELLADSVNAQDALERTIIAAIATELDRAAYFGAGINNEPLGLYNTPGVNEVPMGANGGPITNYDPFVDAMFETESDNSATISAAIMHPRTMRTLRKLKDNQGQPLRMPDDVAAVPKYVTTAFPTTQTMGTGANLSTIIQGDFSHAVVGLRQSLVIKVLDQPWADHLQVGFLAFMRADIQVDQPGAFTRVTGIAA